MVHLLLKPCTSHGNAAQLMGMQNSAYGNETKIGRMKMLPMGMKNDSAILEKQLGNFCKVNHTLALGLAVHSWYLLERNENICSPKNLCMNLSSSSIHKYQILEKTQMPLNK